MKANHRKINFVLVISLMGVLALTASSYVGCGNFDSDEFLDIAQIYQNPNLPMLAFYLSTLPLCRLVPKVLHFKNVILLPSILRC